MNRTEKETFVSDFRDRLDSSPVFYLTDFTGLDVQAMTVLRRRLKEAGAEFLVVKNRLVLRALEGLAGEFPDLGDHLTGPTGVVMGPGGPVEPAKALSEFAEEHGDRPAFKVGVVESRLVESDEFTRLAKLPPREQLLAHIAGAFQAPLAELVGVLSGKLQETAGLLDALREERASQGG